jgi:hypothetical protein
MWLIAIASSSFCKKEIASSFFSGAAESKRDFSFTTTAREVIPIGHGFDNKRSSSISTCNPYWSTRCSVWGYSMVDFVILFLVA